MQLQIRGRLYALVVIFALGCATLAGVLIWLQNERAIEARRHTLQQLVDSAIGVLEVHRKLAEMQHHTTLAKFRFGTPDYDRWAVVWGRIEPRKADEPRKAAANLSYRGEGVIYYITQ